MGWGWSEFLCAFSRLAFGNVPQAARFMDVVDSVHYRDDHTRSQSKTHPMPPGSSLAGLNGASRKVEHATNMIYRDKPPYHVNVPPTKTD